MKARFQNSWKLLSGRKGPIMPKKKAADLAKLIEMVKTETTSAEIMKKMGFKTSTQLKAAYMSALIAEGKVPAIRGGRGAGKAAKSDWRWQERQQHPFKRAGRKPWNWCQRQVHSAKNQGGDSVEESRIIVFITTDTLQHWAGEVLFRSFFFAEHRNANA
jgi:hypothetical protein